MTILQMPSRTTKGVVGRERVGTAFQHLCYALL